MRRERSMTLLLARRYFSAQPSIGYEIFEKRSLRRVENGLNSAGYTTDMTHTYLVNTKCKKTRTHESVRARCLRLSTRYAKIETPYIFPSKAVHAGRVRTRYLRKLALGRVLIADARTAAVLRTRLGSERKYDVTRKTHAWRAISS